MKRSIASRQAKRTHRARKAGEAAAHERRAAKAGLLPYQRVMRLAMQMQDPRAHARAVEKQRRLTENYGVGAGRFALRTHQIAALDAMNSELERYNSLDVDRTGLGQLLTYAAGASVMTGGTHSVPDPGEPTALVIDEVDYGPTEARIVAYMARKQHG